MAKALNVREWVSLVRQFDGTPKRLTLLIFRSPTPQLPALQHGGSR